MKESEAWHIVAEEIDAVRTSSPYFCSALSNYVGNTRIEGIPSALRGRMQRRVDAQLGDCVFAVSSWEHTENGSGYYLTDREERDVRVMSALLFAEIAKDKERAR